MKNGGEWEPVTHIGVWRVYINCTELQPPLSIPIFEIFIIKDNSSKLIVYKYVSLSGSHTN